MSVSVCLSASNRFQASLPSCLTFDFFINVLQNYIPGSSLMQVAVGKPKNYDNMYKSDIYQGEMFYFDAKEVSRVKVVIIRFIGTEAMYLKEEDLWCKIMPKFENILLESGEVIKFAPDYYLCHNSPVKVIVYENIRHKGYESLGRYPDTQQLEMFVLKIAKWHAVSYKLALEDPSQFQNFQNGCMTRPSFGFGSQSLECFVNTLGYHPELRKFQPYFKDLSKKDFLKEIQDLFLEYRDNKQPNIYYGLCHGDFHFRNMMFKGHDDVLFIELQSTYMGPIVHDIIYALTMSLGNFNRKNVQNELICFYFHAFLMSLHAIEFTGEYPKLADFRNQIIKNKKFEFYLIYTYLPIWIRLFTKATVDFTRVRNDCAYRAELYKDENYVQQLEMILPMFLYLGYFDD